MDWLKMRAKKVKDVFWWDTKTESCECYNQWKCNGSAYQEEEVYKYEAGS